MSFWKYVQNFQILRVLLNILAKIISIGRTRNGLYEPLLQENEREAVADLLTYLESKFINPI